MIYCVFNNSMCQSQDNVFVSFLRSIPLPVKQTISQELEGDRMIRQVLAVSFILLNSYSQDINILPAINVCLLLL